MKESHIVSADYSACMHCQHMGSTTSNGEVDYCNLKEGNLRSKRLDPETWLKGCEEFTWNGMPVNETVMEEITTNPEHEGNALRTISEKPGAVSTLVFWDSVNGREWQSWGESFNRKRFEQSYPEEPHVELESK